MALGGPCDAVCGSGGPGGGSTASSTTVSPTAASCPFKARSKGWDNQL